MKERRNLKIRGVVQGIFFRETVRRLASRYEVSGYVRNVGSDTVEIEAEGESNVVTAFIEDVLAHPPHGARIENVQSTAVLPNGDERFTIVPSTP